jgi:hypothetical protein
MKYEPLRMNQTRKVIKLTDWVYFGYFLGVHNYNKFSLKFCYYEEAHRILVFRVVQASNKL